jgi:hypothetical protein
MIPTARRPGSVSERNFICRAVARIACGENSLKTAKALGLDVRTRLQQPVDEVIE